MCVFFMIVVQKACHLRGVKERNYVSHNSVINHPCRWTKQKVHVASCCLQSGPIFKDIMQRTVWKLCFSSSPSMHIQQHVSLGAKHLQTSLHNSTRKIQNMYIMFLSKKTICKTVPTCQIELKLPRHSQSPLNV